MAGPMVLMMAQVDDASGEILGECITMAEDLGARNIQVLPSITKKGRPAHIVFVDAPQAAEPDIAELFGGELGTWGYRVLQAEHRHFDIQRFSATLIVRTGTDEHEFDVRVKVIRDRGRVLRVKAEFDDLSKACASLRAAGLSMAIADLKSAVEDRFDRSAEGPQRLVLQL